MTRGPLYYYFHDKAELYTETARYTIEQLKAQYGAIFHAGLPIRELLRTEFDFCLRQKNMFFHEAPNTRGMPDLREMSNDFTEWILAEKRAAFEAAIARGELRPDCDIDGLITSIYVLYHGIVQVRRMAEVTDGFSDDILQNSTDYFMAMIEAGYLS